MKVRIYFNLHRRLWSVQSYVKGKGWRVIGHAREVYLSDVTFKVSEAGRQRVIREKRKNVHAYAIGTLEYTIGGLLPDGTAWTRYTGTNPFPNEAHKVDGRACWEPVSYNPYRGPDFMMGDWAVDVLPRVLFMPKGKVFGLTSVGEEIYC